MKIFSEASKDGLVDLSQIRIFITEGLGWHVNVYDIHNNENSFIQLQPGIYNLLIKFSDTLFYNEVLLIRLEAKKDILKFSFYKEGGKILCRINSEHISELTKEIVLNELSEELKNIISISKH